MKVFCIVYHDKTRAKPVYVTVRAKSQFHALNKVQRIYWDVNGKYPPVAEALSDMTVRQAYPNQVAPIVTPSINTHILKG